MNSNSDAKASPSMFRFSCFNSKTCWFAEEALYSYTVLHGIRANKNFGLTAYIEELRTPLPPSSRNRRLRHCRISPRESLLSLGEFGHKDRVLGLKAAAKSQASSFALHGLC